MRGSARGPGPGMSARKKITLLMASFLAITLASQALYRNSLDSLHRSLLDVIDAAEVIHQAENYHSAAHQMLMAATDREGPLSPEALRRYQDAKESAQSILTSLSVIRSSVSEHAHEATSIPSVGERLRGPFLAYVSATDALVAQDRTPTDSERHVAELRFSELFRAYLQVLHGFHDDRLDQITNRAHALMTRADVTFFVQLTLLLVLGLAAYLISDKAITRPFARAEVESLTDGLTGLRNRRYLDTVVHEEVGILLRNRHPLSLCLVDIDHFKLFNDQYGHQAGDEVLKHVARILGADLRESDVVVRYGGEEFFILLSGSSPEGAARVLEKLRGELEITDLVVEGQSEPLHVTASFGLVSSPVFRGDLAELIAEADRRLYRAKQEGRNRVIHVETTDPD